MTGVLLAVAAAAAILAAAEIALRRLDLADPPCFQFDSRYGYQLRPMQSVSPRGHRFQINNVGLRGADIGPLVPGERRVVFVGDSIVYGGGKVADAELFVTRVADACHAGCGRPVRGVNVSVPGWGIQNMAAFLDVHGTFAADVVVWVVPSVDFYRGKTSLQQIGFTETKPRSRVGYLLRVWLRANARQRPQTGAARRVAKAEILAGNLAALDRAVDTLRSVGVPTIVAVLPDRTGLRHLGAVVERFKQVAEAHGATFLNLEPVVQAHAVGRLFDDGVHLNRHGHHVVATALVPFVLGTLERRT